ncbi:DeoR family transcriptional regulator [Alkalihalobacillus alcalophilus ATCC 27647 = CGMCC 1.3604]|uniref:Transcription factor FapR n=1 Tax=Alkalihalobacillus alcalophilus ATCC 27647 = CGMCC 1.3604 TaxID=1218173 RepID=A0A094WLN4_ALKAL|nr:transcription factor FapR [Alkalihalobacillus alcalophilus]KGA97731.1 fatty acid biosynthesis transcriptional regulator [Alkalihalobacillus alcalophilus ATCC 27647 = CGMCC 1.3604]MED1563164.1 transcription factor FapR [Alkalihalobacillus alcalophilus]THG90151.1 DeoR family transcriptional regulator [Alkalihalobacillus alcalophilus ATCC 27647 = CGMCC 1.3604]
MKLKKRDRQQLLKETLHNDPFMTDEALASHFNVSIQTIRLDRMELAIPELRERIKDVAKQQLDDVKALAPDEVIGEIVDLQLDERAISILDIQPEQVFAKTGIARGHHLFAQANSLAVAIINDEMALTAKATIRFTRQVRAKERVIAKAEVVRIEGERTVVDVQSYVEQELVFSGEFVMYRSNQWKNNDQ